VIPRDSGRCLNSPYLDHKPSFWQSHHLCNPISCSFFKFVPFLLSRNFADLERGGIHLFSPKRGRYPFNDAKVALVYCNFFWPVLHLGWLFFIEIVAVHFYIFTSYLILFQYLSPFTSLLFSMAPQRIAVNCTEKKTVSR